MKKLFFTLATVATITFNYANASTDAELPANLAHIEITDDAAHCNEKEGEILEVKPLFSEGSFSKTFFDKVVEVNTAIDEFAEKHPYLMEAAKYAIIIAGLIFKPIMTIFCIASSALVIQIIQALVRMVAELEEYFIDMLVDKGYSEEDVNKYVCATFSLCGKILSVIGALSIPCKSANIARTNLATFSPAKIKELVAQRFTFSGKLKRTLNNLINEIANFWSDIQKKTVPILSSAI